MTHSEEMTPRVVLMSTLGVAAVMLLAALDGTIVGTAMPRVIAELQGFEHYAAVTTMYMLTATVVVPIVGKLSDLYGRKPFLLLGVAVFTIASALCGAVGEHDPADCVSRHSGPRRWHRPGHGVHDDRRSLSAGDARPRDGVSRCGVWSGERHRPCNRRVPH